MLTKIAVFLIILAYIIFIVYLILLVSNLSIILGEDTSTVEYDSADSEVNTKLNDIIGGNI